MISRAVSEDEIGRIYSVLALFSAVSVAGHVSQCCTCDTCDTCAGERVPGGGRVPAAVLGHAGHAAGRGVPAGAGRPPAPHHPLQHLAQEVVQSFVMLNDIFP